MDRRLGLHLVLAPVAQRLGALMQSAARYPITQVRSGVERLRMTPRLSDRALRGGGEEIPCACRGARNSRASPSRR